MRTASRKSGVISRKVHFVASDGIRFQFERLPLAGLSLVSRRRIEDERGFIERIYDAEDFSGFGIDRPTVQINRSLTLRAGTVRGMHYQIPPRSEAKLVSCLRGEVFDIAVDLRADSPTFLRWHGEILSAENRRSLFIPEGFAHGFQALRDDCELLYLHSAAYAPDAERRANPLDPRLGIEWPLPVGGMSALDAGQALLPDDFRGVFL